LPVEILLEAVSIEFVQAAGTGHPEEPVYIPDHGILVGQGQSIRGIPLNDPVKILSLSLGGGELLHAAEENEKEETSGNGFTHDPAYPHGANLFAWNASISVFHSLDPINIHQKKPWLPPGMSSWRLAEITGKKSPYSRKENHRNTCQASCPYISRKTLP
jgi:hypothetical protein